MSYTSEHILSFCTQHTIPCTACDAGKFDILYEKLVAFNAHTNVTALKTEEDICSRHFIDSLYPLAFSLIPEHAAVIDIGCGAGFPGLPLAILRPDITVDFVDSTEKKLRFTADILKEFSLRASVFPARAEEFVAKGHRESYDVAVSRAVASLPVLCELCLPFVKVGGIFIAYKSLKECDRENPQSELSLAVKAIPALGARVENIFPAPLAEADGTVSEHALLVLRKVKPTNPIYPRRYAAIVKKPL